MDPWLNEPIDSMSDEPTESETVYWMFDKGISYRASISGNVEPIEWDESDRVTRVCIYIEEEETEYEVVDNSKGRELLELVGNRVTARGLIDHLHRNVYEIRVAEYSQCA
jgi:hypothetical protein